VRISVYRIRWLLAAVFFGAFSQSLHPAEPHVFRDTVLPILTAKCGGCHAGKTKTSGFSTLTSESVIAGGNKHGRAVIEGSPERSPLLKMIKGELQPRMPVGDSLTETQIAAIEKWIRDLPPARGQDASADWRWPYEKPVMRDPPAVHDAAWATNPIDSFILHKLEAEHLKPSPPASKLTLARRVFLDLVGMSPSSHELEAFLNDQSANAYEKLIDRLLADPRYGERWGRHWLDLARYGETSGLEGDGALGNAWRFRDWVIQAFNSNMPYDRFVLLQIGGGDEHSKTRNNYQPDSNNLVPTGFLRLAPWDRSNLVAAEVRANYLAEITSATSSVFLGLTVGCARCHDHKYDPIPTRDFYRMQAFFNTVQAGPPIEVPFKDKEFAAFAAAQVKKYDEQLKKGPEKIELDQFEAELLKKLSSVKVERAAGKPYGKADLRLELKLNESRIFTAAEKSKHADLLEASTRTGDPEEQNALDAYERELLPRLIEAYGSGKFDPAVRFQALTVTDVRAEATAKYSGKSIFSVEEKNRHAELSGKLDILQRRLGRWKPNVLGVTNVAGPPSGPDIAPTRILIRGDYRNPGDIVEPGFPSAITGHSKPAEIETDRYRQFPTRGYRITLARWIASKDNPLTARVWVNRIWQHHFGAGIVRTANDFGKNGERPTHPELLDWLAVKFMESGWDTKGMHKLMLLSSTYKQSAENPTANEKDPENRLLSRFTRRRIEAEAIRDSILSVSGRLNPARGGPSMFPPLPDDLADFARYGRTGGLMWEPNEKEEDAYRRSVYIFQRRSLPLPMMAAFDALPFSEPCERRSSTTTPLQALSMMNGSLIHEESEILAKRIAADVPNDRGAQIARAFELVLNRAPNSEESAYFSKAGTPLEGVCRVLLTSNEFIYTE
jgi:hypothetical protein